MVLDHLKTDHGIGGRIYDGHPLRKARRRSVRILLETSALASIVCMMTVPSLRLTSRIVSWVVAGDGVSLALKLIGSTDDDVTPVVPQAPSRLAKTNGADSDKYFITVLAGQIRL